MSNVRLWDSEWDRPFLLEGRRIDPAARRIQTDGGAVEVEPRVMAVLVALAGRQGETVRRQELIDAVWNGAPGADQSLNNAISLLRRALGDADEIRRLIQTIPKQGYRLCAEIRADGDPDGASSSIPTPRGGPAPALAAVRTRRRRYGALAATFAAAMIVIGAVVSAPRSGPVEPAAPARAEDIDPRSVAILPFANMSADPENAYFSDGLAEEILTALAQVKSLKVAARTDSFQFRGEEASIADIAESLRVANVLEGSVRREGERLRVTAQLISASSGAHIWSSTYDRAAEDILAIQRDIALNIARALADEITEAEQGLLAAPLTENFDAFEQYLIGKHELRKWTPDGNRRALAHFKRAIALDPDFAEAHLAMGRAYYFAGTHYGWMTPAEAIPKVKASLVYGLSAPNPVTRSAALSTYGDVLAWNDRDWPGALAAYKRSYELSGTSPLGYGLTNSIVGKHDTAIAIFTKLLGEGPGSIGINDDIGLRNNLAWAYFNARRYEDALREAGAVLSEDASFADGYRVLGRAQLLMERTDEAIGSFSEAVRLMSGAPTARSDLAVALARAGQESQARAILEELLAAETYVPAPLIAQIYANLGEHDAAFRWLERGVEDGARGVIFLKINPLYDPIREDARFSGLLLQLNLES
ncbi:MAG: winged helix-turn-helix domain-containing protein [Parvularculaceae bacterium]